MSPRERQVFEELRGACQAIIRDWEHNLSHAAQTCQSAVDAAAELDADPERLTVTAEPPVGVKVEPVTLTLHGDLDESLREWLRRKVRSIAIEIYGDMPHSVHWQDECPDCEGPLVKGKCPNVNCPSNATEAV